MALLRPSELARAWQLHPKTVYLWIREGRLPAIKTPGAQYRVRASDARAYCKRHGLPLPPDVARPGGAVALLGRPSATTRAVGKALEQRGTVLLSYASHVEALLSLVTDAPDVVVLDARGDLAVPDVLKALKNVERTREIPVVVYDAATRPAAWLRLGAHTITLRGDDDAAVEAVMQLLDAASSSRS
jgi:excisionase family DNA binding protein